MAPDLNNYLFIDGNYLRRAYEDTMRQFFPQDAVSQRTINFPSIKSALHASKVFYYDTVKEDAADANDRRQFLEDLNCLDGFHIREGSHSERDPKRQKQVDVALAVECLTHAFRKNVWHVSLFTGDLDFKPLVDALINLGTHVHVVYEPKSASRKLYRAADVAFSVNLPKFWEWSTPEFQSANPCPITEHNFYHGPAKVQAEGTWKDRPIEWRNDPANGQQFIFAPPSGRERAMLVSGTKDPDLLKKYFHIVHGEIVWK